MKPTSKKIGKSTKDHFLSHQKRIDIIYLHKVHKVSINKMTVLMKHHYLTVDDVIKRYDRSGRTSQTYAYDFDLSANIEILDTARISNKVKA